MEPAYDPSLVDESSTIDDTPYSLSSLKIDEGPSLSSSEGEVSHVGHDSESELGFYYNFGNTIEYHWQLIGRIEDKYMISYMDMKYKVVPKQRPRLPPPDQYLLPSLGPSYGVVNDDDADSYHRLRAEIVKRVEYYLSYDNLIEDRCLGQHMDGGGWIPLYIIARLPRVRELTTNVKLILEALETSLAIEIWDGNKIRPRHIWGRWITPDRSIMFPIRPLD